MAEPPKSCLLGMPRITGALESSFFPGVFWGWDRNLWVPASVSFSKSFQDGLEAFLSIVGGAGRALWGCMLLLELQRGTNCFDLRPQSRSDLLAALPYQIFGCRASGVEGSLVR